MLWDVFLRLAAQTAYMTDLAKPVITEIQIPICIVITFPKDRSGVARNTPQDNAHIVRIPRTTMGRTLGVRANGRPMLYRQKRQQVLTCIRAKRLSQHIMVLPACIGFCISMCFSSQQETSIATSEQAALRWLKFLHSSSEQKKNNRHLIPAVPH